MKMNYRIGPNAKSLYGVNVTAKRTRLCVAFGAKFVVFAQSRLEKVGLGYTSLGSSI